MVVVAGPEWIHQRDTESTEKIKSSLRIEVQSSKNNELKI